MKWRRDNKKQICGVPVSAPKEAKSLIVPGDLVPKRPSGIRKTGPGAIEVRASRSLDEMLTDLRTPTGTRTDEVAIRIAGQVADSLRSPKPNDVDTSLTQAISAIQEMEPQNLTEAMLATQMIAAHEAGMDFLRRAGADGQCLELFNSYCYGAPV